MGTSTVGHTQAGSQIVRIGHAVQHQQQRRLLQVVEQIVQRTLLADLADAGHHPLVAMAATQTRQAQAIGLDQVDVRLLGALQKLPHARIAPAGIKKYLDHRLRRHFEAHANGVEAKDDFVGCGHGVIIA